MRRCAPPGLWGQGHSRSLATAPLSAGPFATWPLSPTPARRPDPPALHRFWLCALPQSSGPAGSLLSVPAAPLAAAAGPPLAQSCRATGFACRPQWATSFPPFHCPRMARRSRSPEDTRFRHRRRAPPGHRHRPRVSRECVGTSPSVPTTPAPWGRAACLLLAPEHTPLHPSRRAGAPQRGSSRSGPEPASSLRRRHTFRH